MGLLWERGDEGNEGMVSALGVGIDIAAVMCVALPSEQMR